MKNSKIIKRILIPTIATFFLFSCLNEKRTNIDRIEHSDKTQAKQAADDRGEYVVIKAPDRPAERLVKTETQNLPYMGTTRIKGGTELLTTFDGNLGSFEREHGLSLKLNISRIADDPKLEIGTYNLVALGDGVKFQPKTDLYVNYTIATKKDYDNMVLSNMLDDYAEDFYMPFDDKNIFVIESTEDLGETENSSAIISENFQRIKGYIEYTVLKFRTNKAYKFRIEFNLINEIRIFKKPK